MGNDWAWTKSPHITAESSSINAQIINDFRNNTTFDEDQGHPRRTEFQRHLVSSGLSLRGVLHDLLMQIQFRSIEDSQQFITVLSLLQGILKHDPSTPAAVYLMSGGRNRERRVDSKDRLGSRSTLFQGAHPVEGGPQRGSIYPGDRAKKIPTGVTVQIHTLTIVRENGERRENIPAIAVWIPENLARPILVQPQGGS